MNLVVEKLVTQTPGVVALMAALPYRISGVATPELERTPYNAQGQRSVYRRSYSTCRYDESAGILTSKSDTSRDD